MKNLLLASIIMPALLYAQDENAWSGDDPGQNVAEQAEHFDILQLPPGASVVLPHPASTVVPLNLKVRVAATDKKQILKIGAVAESPASKTIKLAIYDSEQNRVKYMSLRPGSFLIYAFKNLNTLQLVPLNSKDPKLSQTKLLLESNRPLSVSY